VCLLCCWGLGIEGVGLLGVFALGVLKRGGFLLHVRRGPAVVEGWGPAGHPALLCICGPACRVGRVGDVLLCCLVGEGPALGRLPSHS
jgi:hypothetical protein